MADVAQPPVRVTPEARRAIGHGLPALVPLVDRLDGPGAPAVRARTPGFPSLVRIVVEQAVSQVSADAVWGRLAQPGPPTPARVEAAGAAGLRAAGLSMAKARCLLGLSEAALSGALDLDALATEPDAVIRSRLMGFRGIGRWTADIYLLLALRRPDVFPAHDLALQEALRSVLRLERRPSAREADRVAEPIRPHRSVATLALWDHYLRG